MAGVLFSIAMLLAAQPVATILCYHEVDPPAALHSTIPRESAKQNGAAEMLRYTATPDQFRQQLDYLAAHDYHVVPLRDVIEYLRGERKSLPSRAVVITVDDGWSCAYDEIYPAMRERKLPWTLFVYPKIVGRGAHSVTWKEIGEMAHNGVDVESHTFTHPFLTRNADLGHELVDSKSLIEKQRGSRVAFLCYPYGDYDAAVIDTARRAGYEAAVTTKRGEVTLMTPLMELPRYSIHNDTTLEEFAQFLR